MPFSPSTNTGLVKRNSRMLPTRWVRRDHAASHLARDDRRAGAGKRVAMGAVRVAKSLPR
jgi:hypothetical protein